MDGFRPLLYGEFKSKRDYLAILCAKARSLSKEWDICPLGISGGEAAKLQVDRRL